MKVKGFQIFIAGLLIFPLIHSLFFDVPNSLAQESQTWTTPVNLSKAGSSTSPQLVIDATGTIHVIWIDEFDGYKYVTSTDGVEWTSPITVTFPFSPDDDFPPVFVAEPAGGIYAVWTSNLYALYYSKLAPGSDFKSGWSGRNKIDSSVLAFDALVSPQGILHVGYTSSLSTAAHPAGVYYFQLSGTKRSNAINVYSSQYFRSLLPEDAHIGVAVDETEESETVYMVWDDRSQKRIFMAKSIDALENWGEAKQIVGPEDFTGTTIPLNVNIGVLNDHVLLTWQLGLPGEQCTQYSAWSKDGGTNFEQPVKVSDQFVVCPQANEFVQLNNDFSIVLFNVLDEISLAAWNGSVWSRPQSQSQISAFLNPTTLDSVFFGCQKVSSKGKTLYIVGCDQGDGGDIWFSSRSLGTFKDWFPSVTTWSNTTTEVTSVDQKISALTSVADDQNNIHAFWVQTPFFDTGNSEATIQYARWNGEAWSSPVSIISGLEGKPIQLNVYADSLGRLLLAWVDSKTGDMFLSWASAERANIATEWNSPQYIPSTSQANSSPDIQVDASGRILVSYAIPINESRGIYFVESDDGGVTWTQPFEAFDAATASWEMVDEPKIILNEDGRLHILFGQYSFQGDQRQSLGLYYTRSEDGGASWSEPEVVSDNPISWSQIDGYDESIVHRLWQEKGQSQLISFHQVSQDGGLTWSNSAVISSLSEPISLNSETMDPTGNLYFVQVTGEGNISLLDHIWNGAGWSSGEPKEIYNTNRIVPSSMNTNITPSGELLVSISVDYPFLSGELKNNILSVRKSLELPEFVQNPQTVVIPAIGSTVVMPEQTLITVPSPTVISPLADINESPSFFARNKNLIGFILLGVILVLITFVLWPASKKQNV